MLLTGQRVTSFDMLMKQPRQSNYRLAIGICYVVINGGHYARHMRLAKRLSDTASLLVTHKGQ